MTNRTIVGTALLGFTLCLTACGSDNGQPAEPKITVIDDDVPYPEGPLWIQDQLYYVGYASDKVLSWDGNSVKTVWEAPAGEAFTRCGPSSLVRRDNGNLLVSCYDTNQVVEITLSGTRVADYDRDETGAPFVGPNDFTRDVQGGVYFSASGVFDETQPASGKIFYLSPTDLIHDAAPGETFSYSNGLALMDADSRLLVSEHLENTVTELEVQSPGVLTNRRVFKALSDIAPNPAEPDPKIGPDGLKVGPTTGNLYICQWSASRILITRPTGDLLREITLPHPYVTNINFRGTDESVLFVSVETDANNPDWVYSGKLYQVTLP